jgi:thioredoxin-like negative regulator of GroEL
VHEDASHTPHPIGPLRLREALVIALAIVVVGGAFFWSRHREEMAVLELQRAAAEHAVQAEAQLAPLGEARATELRDLALRAVEQQQLAEAARLLTELLRRRPLDLEARYQLARVLLADGQSETAREHLVIIISLPDTGEPDQARLQEEARALLGD